MKKSDTKKQKGAMDLAKLGVGVGRIEVRTVNSEKVSSRKK